MEIEYKDDDNGFSIADHESLIPHKVTDYQSFYHFNKGWLKAEAHLFRIFSIAAENLRVEVNLYCKRRQRAS